MVWVGWGHNFDGGDMHFDGESCMLMALMHVHDEVLHFDVGMCIIHFDGFLYFGGDVMVYFDVEVI